MYYGRSLVSRPHTLQVKRDVKGVRFHGSLFSLEVVQHTAFGFKRASRACPFEISFAVKDKSKPSFPSLKFED